MIIRIALGKKAITVLNLSQFLHAQGQTLTDLYKPTSSPQPTTATTVDSTASTASEATTTSEATTATTTTTDGGETVAASGEEAKTEVVEAEKYDKTDRWELVLPKKVATFPWHFL
jgi:hypothetical protein